jgi:peroxiredoxin
MATSPKVYTFAKYIAAILVVGILGFFSAQQVAAYLIAMKADDALQEKREYRREFTRGVLKSMNTLQVGDVLPDYQFEDGSHNPLTLSGLATGNTLLIFFDPTCDGCDDELRAINDAVTDTLDYRRFRLICAGDSGLVAEKVEMLDLHSPLLHDHSGDYFFQIGVFTYPFNIIVNKDRVIQDMIAGSLDRMDLTRFVEKGQLD